MMYSKFSPKQLRSMLWWADSGKRFDAVICDGSVRSGKTMSMAIGFVLWSCRSFRNQNFALCGKTVTSLMRNVVTPMQNWLEGIAKVTIRQSRSYMEITLNENTNRYYLFGGKDEGSAALIQGMTLAGVLFDEVALMPRSFVEQALARCSVEHSKFWFNCNPESPGHWFYTEWILKSQEKRALYLHFTMADNYSLAREVRERYERMYSGVFYERFIQGKWVVSEGIIYPMFDRKKHVGKPKNMEGDLYISVDYGTLNPTSFGLWLLTPDGHAWRLKEYYYDARKQGSSLTDEQYYAALRKFAGKLTSQIECVIVDPSAASFITCIYEHDEFEVRKAKNDVLDGIRNTATLLQLGRLHFSPECKDILREFGQYRWDEKKTGTDAPVKEFDHAMDDMRYFVNTIMIYEAEPFGTPPGGGVS